MAQKKLSEEILKEAHELWLGGMGWRPMERFLNAKYPGLDISHQSLMHHISPKHRAREKERKFKMTQELIAARHKEYTDSLKKLYVKKTKKVK